MYFSLMLLEGLGEQKKRTPLAELTGHIEMCHAYLKRIKCSVFLTFRFFYVIAVLPLPTYVFLLDTGRRHNNFEILPHGL